MTEGLGIALAAVIAELMARLGPAEPEIHIVLAPDGQLVSRRSGTPAEVMTGDIPAALLRGAVTVHQHPGLPAWPPSENDIVNALAVGEQATFIVAADGLHRWLTRQPAADGPEAGRFSELLDAAEEIETRALQRCGWYGNKTVPVRLLGQLPGEVGAELCRLAQAYPEFARYELFDPRQPARYWPPAAWPEPADRP